MLEECRVQGDRVRLRAAPMRGLDPSSPSHRERRRLRLLGAGHRLPAVSGGDQACRGAHSKDNSANYYTVVREQSLDACKLACSRYGTDCKGIEYSAGRCEVWTRPEGIQATFPLKGFSCLRYQPSASTAALVQKKSRSRRHFLGPAFLQTGYQPSVTEFTEGAVTEL